MSDAAYLHQLQPPSPLRAVMDIEKLAQSIFNKHSNSIVIIRNKSKTLNKPMLGTGLIVRSTSTSCLIMTCQHVINKSDHTLCVRFTGKLSEHNAKVVYEDRRSDLAILRVQDLDTEYPSLKFGAAENVPAKTDVVLLGHIFLHEDEAVLNLYPGVSPGITSAPLQDCGHGMKDLVFTSQGVPGCSGSPVMLGDEVIGIMYSELLQILNARSSETVNTVLKSWLKITPDATHTTKELIDMIQI